MQLESKGIDVFWTTNQVFMCLFRAINHLSGVSAQFILYSSMRATFTYFGLTLKSGKGKQIPHLIFLPISFVPPTLLFSLWLSQKISPIWTAVFFQSIVLLWTQRDIPIRLCVSFNLNFPFFTFSGTRHNP